MPAVAGCNGKQHTPSELLEQAFQVKVAACRFYCDRAVPEGGES